VDSTRAAAIEGLLDRLAATSVLVHTAEEFLAFLLGVKHGEFDDLMNSDRAGHQ
jgi:hypothetical protein